MQPLKEVSTIRVAFFTSFACSAFRKCELKHRARSFVMSQRALILLLLVTILVLSPSKYEKVTTSKSFCSMLDLRTGGLTCCFLEIYEVSWRIN